jgi:PmbA protein
VSDAATLLEKARETVRRGRRIGADAIEVFATAEREAKVHLEADDLGTAHSHDEERFGIRVRLRGASGFASTNDASQEARDEAVRAALAVAAVSPPDPFDDLAPPTRTTTVAGLHDAALEELDVETLGKLCAELAARARDTDGRVRIDSGWILRSAQTTAIATSTGIALCERTTQADALLFGMAVEGERVGSFDSEQAAVCSLAELRAELEALPRRWVAKVTSSLAAGPGETFRGTLVLSREAVAEFMLPALVGSLSAQAVRMGRSRFAGKIGERAFSAGLSITDDGTLPGRPGSASFDREGIPHQPLPLVARGELRSFLWNTREARAAARAEGSTGHASGGPRAAPGIGPTSLLVGEGDQPDDALVREVAHGILLSRFSGNSDAVSGDFSGVAKGSFLLRSGEAPRPIQETLVSGNLYELLAAVSGVGRERRWIDGTVLAPLVRVEGVSVTSG